MSDFDSSCIHVIDSDGVKALTGSACPAEVIDRAHQTLFGQRAELNIASYTFAYTFAYIFAYTTTDLSNMFKKKPNVKDLVHLYLKYD